MGSIFGQVTVICLALLPPTGTGGAGLLGFLAFPILALLALAGASSPASLKAFNVS